MTRFVSIFAVALLVVVSVDAAKSGAGNIPVFEADGAFASRCAGLAPERLAALQRLTVHLRNDAQLRNAGVWRVEYVMRLVESARSGKVQTRSSESVLPGLGEAAVLYALCGGDELKTFLHDSLLDAAGRPPEFFIERNFKSERPVASFSTAVVARQVAFTLDLVGRNVLTSSERNEVISALKTSLLLPLVNRLNNRDKALNRLNYALALVPLARVCGDKVAAEAALAEIRESLPKLVESDGGVINDVFGLRDTVFGFTEFLLALTPEERRSIAPLCFPKLAGYLLKTEFNVFDSEGQMRYMRPYFHASAVGGIPPAPPLLAAALLNDDREAALAGTRSAGTSWYLARLIDWVLWAEYGCLELAPAVTETLEQPGAFASSGGDSMVRAGRGSGAPVLAMTGSRSFAHAVSRVPESNSVLLFACGEYLIVPSGPIPDAVKRREYSTSSVSANTVMIDDRNQKHPRAMTGRRDVRGNPQSEIVACVSRNGVNIVVQNSAKSYAISQRSACRAVIGLEKKGVFVVIDRFSGDGKPHIFDQRWHFNTRNRRGTLTRIGMGHWNFVRGDVKLELRSSVVGGASELVSQSRAAYGSKPGDDRLGTAVELDIRTGKRLDFTALTVLQARRGDAKFSEVKFDKFGVTIDGMPILLDGRCLKVGEAVYAQLP